MLPKDLGNHRTTTTMAPTRLESNGRDHFLIKSITTQRSFRNTQGSLFLSLTVFHFLCHKSSSEEEEKGSKTRTRKDLTVYDVGRNGWLWLRQARMP